MQEGLGSEEANVRGGDEGELSRRPKPDLDDRCEALAHEVGRQSIHECCWAQYCPSHFPLRLLFQVQFDVMFAGEVRYKCWVCVGFLAVSIDRSIDEHCGKRQ